MGTEAPHFEINMSSHPQYLSVVRATVEASGRALGFDATDCHQLALAVNEAIANVIRHGYRGQTGRPIALRIESAECDQRRGICIVLEDECGEVDLAKIKGRPLDEIRPGGLGVHIISELMDRVEYSHRSGNSGLRLRMCKFLPAAHAAACKEKP